MLRMQTTNGFSLVVCLVVVGCGSEDSGVGTPALTAPANLTYGTTHAMYAVDVANSPNVPTSSGGAIEGQNGGRRGFYYSA